MSCRVMGLTAGRKNSNAEFLLKEALMACEEQGGFFANPENMKLVQELRPKYVEKKYRAI